MLPPATAGVETVLRGAAAPVPPRSSMMSRVRVMMSATTSVGGRFQGNLRRRDGVGVATDTNVRWGVPPKKAGETSSCPSQWPRTPTAFALARGEGLNRTGIIADAAEMATNQGCSAPEAAAAAVVAVLAGAR